MHVGSFYGSRGPEALLEVLSEIANPAIQFVQIGAPCEVLYAYPNVNVRVIQRVQHKEALEMMRNASILYLKQGFEPGVTDYIAVAAKTYEYLATGLPILADCPEGDNAELVRQYCAHPLTVTSGNKQDLKAAVLEAYSHREQMVPSVTRTFVDTFDRVRLTSQLAAMFDDVAGRHS
jgi:hypothetical protein